MTQRPLSRKSIDQLEQLVQSTPTRSALEQVSEELAIRRTHRAKKLLQTVRQRLNTTPGRATATKKATDRTTRTATKKATDRTTRTPGRPAAPRLRAPDWDARYEVLRATFTVEAEVLARWGMTAAMPYDLEEIVFSAWERRLEGAIDEYGRSKERLESDRHQLQLERQATDTYYRGSSGGN